MILRAFFVVWLSLLLVSTTQARTVEQIKATIASYVQLASDQRDYNEIEALAREVLAISSLYDNETLGQIYLLLADRANEQGDSTKAIKFAENGLSYDKLSLDTRLSLMLHVAHGYYSRGQYDQVLETANEVLALAPGSSQKIYQTHALALRAMANALQGNYMQGMKDLEEVTRRIEESKTYDQHIEVLETLAVANSYFGDYQTALELQEKLINLRYRLKLNSNLERSFYNLANVYEQLGRYDDAYTWYMESKLLAEKNGAAIRVAYAELGLGKVLLVQELYRQAFESLERAERIFKGQNLNNPYISTLIHLAEASLALEMKPKAYKLLEQALVLAEVTNLSNQQIDFYKLLAKMYADQQDYARAFQMLNHFTVRKEKFYRQTTLLKQEKAELMTEQSRQIVLNLADKGTLAKQHADELEKYRSANLILAMIAAVAMIGGLWFWFKQKNALNQQDANASTDLFQLLPNSEFTRQIYKREYKSARYFEYPICFALLSIANWRDIQFHFDKRTLAELHKSLSQLLVENIGPYDKVGPIGNDEYLLMFPQQDKTSVLSLLKRIDEELAVRVFANLGEYKIAVNYVCESPLVQDIDPYIFLAKISESLNENELK